MKLDLNDPGLNLYLRVYNYYKDLICSGKMQPGTRLPSIRKCAMQLQLSRTTVETAYMLLAAEGYIPVSYTHLDVYKRQIKGGKRPFDPNIMTLD